MLDFSNNWSKLSKNIWLHAKNKSNTIQKYNSIYVQKFYVNTWFQ